MTNIKQIHIVNLVILICTLLFMENCSSQKEEYMSIDDILKENKQIKTVLDKYKNDSLKLQAAIFLIENLPYHYSYEGEAIDNYHKLYELHSTGKYYPEKVLDSIYSIYKHFDYRDVNTKKDIYIDSDYLIDNIEWAFKVWEEQPWGKNIIFKDFCEYILPYRIGNEPLIPWRKKIYETFNPVLDSIRTLPEAEDPLFAAQVMLKHLQSRSPFYFTYIFQGPHVGPDIVNWYSGYCRESTDILIYVFRALGIPCGRDFIAVRGNDNAGHEWNFVLDKTRNSYYGCITYAPDKFEPSDTFWWSKGKVYRQTFSMNKQAMDKMNISPEKIYPFFKYLQFVDATHCYTGEYNHSVTIPHCNLYHKPKEKELVYLCSSSRQEWIPLDWSSFYKKQDSIRFQNVEGDVVFRLMTYENKCLKSLTDPFLLDKKTGSIRYFQPSQDFEEVKILHKFHLHWTYPWQMVGGVFEGSNSPDFLKADTLFVIKERPQRKWNILRVNNEKKYRYLRYIGPKDSHCNVAEVSFFANYNDTIPLEGIPIGTKNNEELEKTHNYSNVFDGNTETSFTYCKPNGGWAGLKLPHNQKVEKIIYTARNRDNFINKGDLYELFYDKGGKWVSAGKREATSDSLMYNIPKGTLLYLKNHSRGKDERIFEINERFYNIEQIFW